MTTPFQTTQTFVPTQIPGCQLWFDAADQTSFSFSAGTTISEWRDKSSNAYSVIQPTALRQPSLTSGAQNRLPGIQFGSNLYLFQTSTSMPAFTTGGSTSVLMAARNATNNDSWNIINTIWFDSAGGSATLRYHFSFNQGVTDGTTLFTNGSLAGQVTSNAVAPSANAILGFTASATSQTIHTNGSTNSFTGTTLPNATGTSAFTFNDARNNAASANTMIFEMVGYNTQLTTPQRQLLEGYLAWKWNLVAQLPADHPYKTTSILSLPPFQNAPRSRTVQPISLPLPFPRVPYATSRLFNPTSIPGCSLWLDAADPGTVTVSGSTVTGVLDKSSSNVTLSNSSGFTYPNNTFNGRRPSFFVTGGGNSGGGTQRLGVNSAFALPTPFTVSFVCQHVGAANYGYILDSGPSGSGRPYILDGAAGPRFETPVGSGGLLTTSPLLTSIIFGSSAVAFQNGVQQFTGSATFTTGGITIGNRFTLNESWPGHICELILHNTALTSFQRQQVEGYLAWKWGLQGTLPSNHPYKLFPPSP